MPYFVGLIISAGLLCLVMYLVARHEAEINFTIVLAITVGVSILNAILSRFIGYWAIPIVFGTLAWALQQFCTLRWSKAILVTVVYIAASTGLAIVLR